MTLIQTTALWTGRLALAAAAALTIAWPAAAQEQVVITRPAGAASPTPAPLVGQTSLSSPLDGVHSAPTVQPAAKAAADGSPAGADPPQQTAAQAPPAETPPETAPAAALPSPGVDPATATPAEVPQQKSHGVPLWAAILIALVALLSGLQLARRPKSS